MSDAPVCHISTGSRIIAQPRPTLLPTIPVAVDLPSAIVAINQLKLLIQMISGQQAVTGAGAAPGSAGAAPGSAGLRGLSGSVGVAGSPGKQGQKGKDGKNPKGGRFQEDKSRRVKAKKKIYQDNDKTSDNWVEIEQINRVVWVDNVTGEEIVWSR